MPKTNILISEQEYIMLIERDMLLNALQEAGVDNWSGYDEAQAILKEMKGE